MKTLLRFCVPAFLILVLCAAKPKPQMKCEGYSRASIHCTSCRYCAYCAAGDPPKRAEKNSAVCTACEARKIPPRK